jgi:NAD+ kinase
MKVGIYTRNIQHELSLSTFQKVVAFLEDLETEVMLHGEMIDFIQTLYSDKVPYRKFFQCDLSTPELNPDLVISIGGDGTILDTLCIVRDTGIPVLGINTGRLGFLAGANTQNFKEVIGSFLKGIHIIDSRHLLSIETSSPLFEYNFALNDLVIHKKDSSTMIQVHTYLNGAYFNSYWADGLICSTPTGSTGYNLSCGGPILYPKSSNFVITPIAPHNLNVRPFVIPDDHVLSFEVEGRSAEFLAVLDARSMPFDANIQIAVKKATFDFNLVRLPQQSFLSTLKEKMMWGLDKRN